ncbi:NAD-P-binding protein [Stereum hirsutum FP-91666 SS1]|uniref:NAD-P-binding protein n=1 Tax=Stereum hirsutum (strain FP-91666) TaxID=721885 RepID=UPI000440E2D5|nr:NAD-P-binding protein [Stereum hirsutum FP-91666 SS1]EIM87335.1 NAD-P-binding protein [Stereum hirsutum FP-91666 SS1]
MPFLTLGGFPAFIYQQLFITPTLDPTLTFAGQTVIITGANIGLGFCAAQQIAQRGISKLILAVRSLSKGEAAAAQIRASLSSSQSLEIEVWPLDLSSYQSVKDFTTRAKGLERLDVLLENAGIGKDDFSVTEDDEATITTNVVCTTLLALLLLPKLRETAEKFEVVPHLTMVSSETAFWAKFEERKADNIFEKLADPKSNMADRYMTSKLIAIYCFLEIASRSFSSSAPPVIINYVNPGFCRSSLDRDMKGNVITSIFKLLLQRKTEVGARTLVHASVAGKESHGQYLCDCLVHPSPVDRSDLVAERDELQKKIWSEMTMKLEKIEPGVTRVV